MTNSDLPVPRVVPWERRKLAKEGCHQPRSCMLVAPWFIAGPGQDGADSGLGQGVAAAGSPRSHPRQDAEALEQERSRGGLPFSWPCPTLCICPVRAGSCEHRNLRCGRRFPLPRGGRGVGVSGRRYLRAAAPPGGRRGRLPRTGCEHGLPGPATRQQLHPGRGALGDRAADHHPFRLLAAGGGE